VSERGRRVQPVSDDPPAASPDPESADPGPADTTLADKINRMFEVMHPRERGPLSNEEAAAAINAQGRTTISASYLWLLRTGRRDNPGKHHLEALAELFGISPGYFFDDDTARTIDRELTLLAAMRDAGVRHLALRAAELSPDALAAIQVMVEQARKVERIPNASEVAGSADPEADR
jgi:transcriptional regulator with XRE-family HTH domain